MFSPLSTLTASSRLFHPRKSGSQRGLRRHGISEVLGKAPHLGDGALEANPGKAWRSWLRGGGRAGPFPGGLGRRREGPAGRLHQVQEENAGLEGESPPQKFQFPQL